MNNKPAHTPQVTPDDGNFVNFKIFAHFDARIISRWIVNAIFETSPQFPSSDLKLPNSRPDMSSSSRLPHLVQLRQHLLRLANQLLPLRPQHLVSVRLHGIEL